MLRNLYNRVLFGEISVQYESLINGEREEGRNPTIVKRVEDYVNDLVKRRGGYRDDWYPDRDALVADVFSWHFGRCMTHNDLRALDFTQYA